MHHSSLQAVAFVVISLISVVFSVPIAAPDSCTPDNFPNCNQPPETSVYFCENINWEPPCYVFWLGRDENGAIYEWKGNNVGSPWPDNSWTVGSIGPAQGINLLIEGQNADLGTGNTTSVSYPGLSDVGDYWRENIYSFVASWDPGVEPMVKGREAEKERLASSNSAKGNPESANE